MQGQKPLNEHDFLTSVRARCETLVEMGVSLIDNIDARLGTLNARLPLPTAEPVAEAAVPATWTSGQDRKRLIRDYLQSFGPSSIKAVAAALGTSYQSVFNLVSKGHHSMVADGSITIGNERPALLHPVPGYTLTQEQRLEPYRELLLSFRTQDEIDNPRVDLLIHDFSETLLRYTEEVIWVKNHGERRQAGRIRKALRNNGVVGAIAVIATGRVRSGLHALHALGYGDLTAEALVLKYPDLFEQRTIDKAKARIAEGASDTEVDEADDAE